MSSSPGLSSVRAEGGTGDTLPEETQSSKGSRSKVSIACLYCKQKKAKCSGNTPCDKCRRDGVECVYNELLDKRKGVKRRFQELEQAKDLLEDIVYTFQKGNGIQQQTLLDVISSNASMQDIQSFLELNGLRNRGEWPGVHALLNEHALANKQEPGRRMPLMYELCEPVYKVKAKPWVTITDDDELVSRLVSVYMTWTQPTHWVMDIDLFLRDMRKGEQPAKYCNPFLVNAMLAIGCILTDVAESSISPVNPTIRARRFLEEVQRISDEEGSTPSIPNLQALHLWLYAENVIGRDQVGWMILSRMNQMYRELGYDSWELPDIDPTTPEEYEAQKARNHTAWAVFVATCASSMIFLRRIVLPPPKLPLPAVGKELEETVTWRPYPRLSSSQQIPMKRSFDSFCNLCVISFDISTLLFVDLKTISADEVWDRTMILVQRLWEWRDTLHGSISFKEKIVPNTLDLAGIYVQFFVTLTESAQNPLKSNPSRVQALRNFGLEAIFSFHESIRHYKYRFGFEIVPIIGLCGTTLSCNVLLTALDHPQTESALLDFLTVLTCASRRLLLMAGASRMFQALATKLKVELPKSVKHILANFDKSYWTNSMADDLRSSFPSYHESWAMSESVAVRMSEVIEDMKNIKLDEIEPDAHRSANDHNKSGSPARKF